jgi:hypothetical protein
MYHIALFNTQSGMVTVSSIEVDKDRLNYVIARLLCDVPSHVQIQVVSV